MTVEDVRHPSSMMRSCATSGSTAPCADGRSPQAIRDLLVGVTATGPPRSSSSRPARTASPHRYLGAALPGSQPVSSGEDLGGAVGEVELGVVAEGVGDDLAGGGRVSLVDHDAGQVQAGGF